MDFQLNEEQRMWQKAVHEFCQTELKLRATQTDAEARLPLDVVKKMAPVGLLALPVSEADGGPGLDSISAAIAIEEIGRACGSTALLGGGSQWVVPQPISSLWHDGAKGQVPACFDVGGDIGCFSPDRAGRG